MKPVDFFVAAVRQRLNRNRACRAILWAIVGGGGVLLIVALTYVLRGYEVPGFWYVIAGIATAVAGIIGAVTHRTSEQEAAAFADDFFGIKDAIVSNRRFEADHRAGGYYDLQAGQTAEVVRPLDARRVPFVWPRALGTSALLILTACLLTAFKSTSPEIIAKQKEQQRVESELEQLKKDLLEEIEKLEKSTSSEEEKKALDPEQLKEMVKQMESTKEIQEALKQLANLERKLDNAAKSLAAKRDEKLLKKAAEELEKEEDPQARELARKLKNEQFKEAAKDLERMKPEDAKLAKDKKLSDKRKEAARLKAMAKRMASAARQQKSSQSKDSKENGDKNSDRKNDRNDGKKNDKSGENSDDSKMDKAEEQEPQESDELAEDMEKLEMEADELDQDLEDLEEGEKLGKIDLAKLEKSDQDGEKLRMRLDKMGDKLAKLGMKSDARKKLLGLSKKAGQCQGFMQGLVQSPFAGKGGHKPGDGSVDSSRDEKDELTDNGNTTQLKGQKGTGPSITKVEAADDGTGTSHRKAEAKERAFKKQFESFVQREDVPEDVKDGVKHYFESLHEAEPAGGTPKDGTK